MSAREFQEWRIYMRRRPRLEARVDAATTLITWHIDMVRRMFAKRPPEDPKKFFPWVEKQDNFEPTPQLSEVETKMRKWMKLEAQRHGVVK